MTSKEALLDIQKRNEALKKEGHFHIGTLTIGVIEKLVERDTPMKIVRARDWCYYCPSCKEEVDVSNVDYDTEQIYRHCYHCGQRLDWSE